MQSLRDIISASSILGVRTSSSVDHDKYVCPYHHNDTEGSLAVFDNHAYCFACETYRDKMSFLMGEHSDYLNSPEVRQRIAVGETKTKSHATKIYAEPPDAIYDSKTECFHKPAHVYRYRTPDGIDQLLVYRAHIEDTDEQGVKSVRKEIRPLTRVAQGWKWGAPSQDRPMYCSEVFSDKREMVIVEGEKTADFVNEVARRAGMSLVATTSSGGANAADKTDWSLLSGRRVFIWPDKNDAGIAYANAVILKAHEHEVQEISILDVSDLPVPPGGDAADLTMEEVSQQLIHGKWSLVDKDGVKKAQKKKKEFAAKVQEEEKRLHTSLDFDYKMAKLIIDEYGVTLARNKANTLVATFRHQKYKGVLHTVGSDAWVSVIKSILGEVCGKATHRKAVELSCEFKRIAAERSVPTAGVRHLVHGYDIYTAMDEDSVLVSTAGYITTAEKYFAPNMLSKCSRDSLPYVTEEPEQNLRFFIDKHFTNVSPTLRPLLAGWLCVCLLGKMEELPIPILCLAGSAGSGKSTVAKNLGNIIDPSTNHGVALPTDPRTFNVVFSNMDVPVFDNVERIKKEVSDIMCIAISGGAHISRALFTDSTMAKVDLKSTMILTAISIPTYSQDLVDRFQVVELDKIETNVPLDKLMTAFDKDLPYIRYLILKTASILLTPQFMDAPAPFNLNPRFRFSKYAALAAQGAYLSGYAVSEFEEAFNESRESALDDVEDSSDFISRFVIFAQTSKNWTGTARDLYECLTANTNVMEREQWVNFPKRAAEVVKILKRSMGILSDRGIVVKFIKNKFNKVIEVSVL